MLLISLSKNCGFKSRCASKNLLSLFSVLGSSGIFSPCKGQARRAEKAPEPQKSFLSNKNK